MTSFKICWIKTVEGLTNQSHYWWKWENTKTPKKKALVPSQLYNRTLFCDLHSWNTQRCKKIHDKYICQCVQNSILSQVKYRNCEMATFILVLFCFFCFVLHCSGNVNPTFRNAFIQIKMKETVVCLFLKLSSSNQPQQAAKWGKSKRNWLIFYQVRVRTGSPAYNTHTKLSMLKENNQRMFLHTLWHWLLYIFLGYFFHCIFLCIMSRETRKKGGGRYFICLFHCKIGLSLCMMITSHRCLWWTKPDIVP